MASHFMPVRSPPPTVHNFQHDNGNPTASGPSIATGSRPYRTKVSSSTLAMKRTILDFIFSGEMILRQLVK